MELKSLFIFSTGLMLFTFACCRPSFGQAVPDCDSALSICNSSCDDAKIKSNYGHGEELLIQPADFKKECEASCKAGFTSCKQQDSIQSCNTFNYHCASACPWTVTITEPFAGLSIGADQTDSFWKCSWACSIGNTACELERKKMPPRKRSAEFNACVEAQFACYKSCSAGPFNEIDQCAEACFRGIAPCNTIPASSKCISEKDCPKCKAYYDGCASTCPPLTDDNDIGIQEWGEPEGVSYCEDACEVGADNCQAILK